MSNTKISYFVKRNDIIYQQVQMSESKIVSRRIAIQPCK